MPRPRKVDAGEYELPPPSSNGGKTSPDRPYGRIVEIRAREIPIRAQGRWMPLLRELMLRLEQTPAHKALAIEFYDEPTLHRAESSLHTLARNHYGKKVIRLDTKVLEDGTPMLYVRRGENWNHRRDPDADPIPTDDVVPLDSDPIEEETHDQENPNGRGRGRPRRDARGG